MNGCDYMAINSFEDLPIMLNAVQVRKILGISKASVYNLFHSKGFPAFRIGKRLVVAKESLRRWIEEQENKVL